MGFLSNFGQNDVQQGGAGQAGAKPGENNMVRTETLRAILTMPVAIAAPDGAMDQATGVVLSRVLLSVPLLRASAADEMKDLTDDILAEIAERGADKVMRAGVSVMTMAERRLALRLAMEMSRDNPVFQIGDVLFLVEMQCAMGIREDEFSLLADAQGLFGTQSAA